MSDSNIQQFPNGASLASDSDSGRGPSEINVANIKVVGVGGGGVNAINRMINEGLRGVEFIAVNTDMQALLLTDADVKIEIGHNVTRGLGAGAEPEVGRQSAEEKKDDLEDALRDADMVFVTAGEGGGTGTGAAPVVASIARKLGALTVGVVTRPFAFEGARRARLASEGIEELRKHVDTLIVIPNDRLLSLSDGNLTVVEAFIAADKILHNAVEGITKVITQAGMMNLDFADVRTVLKDAGTALIGVGSAQGENRVVDALTAAINSPLLESSMAGAKRVLLAFAGSSDLKMHEVNLAGGIVNSMADEDVLTITGNAIDENLGDEVRVTVIAAGFEDNNGNANAPIPVAQPNATPAPESPSIFSTPAPEAAATPVTPPPAAAAPVTPAPQHEAPRHRSGSNGLFTEAPQRGFEAPSRPARPDFDDDDDLDVPSFFN